MKQYDIICIGVALVDSIIKGFVPEPVSASGYIAESGTLKAGGDAFNVAVTAAKLGMRTGILCHLGNDLAGELLMRELAENNVDTEHAIRSGEHLTPVTTMFVREDGSRQSITNESHRYNFHPEHHAALLEHTRAVTLGSLFRAPFDDPEVIHAVLQSTSQNGALVFADTKLPNFRKLSLEDIAESLPLIDFLTPNEDEARYFTGEEDPAKMADRFLDKGVRHVIIKLGERGCLFRSRDAATALPAFDVQVVDATGAGDNFLAGFVSELLRGNQVREALTFANACGAICCTKPGAATALRNREQVERFRLTMATKPAAMTDV